MLYFQPCQCPALNPVEQLWTYMKTKLLIQHLIDKQKIEKYSSEQRMGIYNMLR